MRRDGASALAAYCARFFRENGREARGAVYVDGLNFYRRALRETRCKWLDLQEWARKALPSECELVAVHYFTSEVKGAADPDAPNRQRIYLGALRDWSGGAPILRVHQGASQWKRQKGRLVGNSPGEDFCRRLGFLARRAWARIFRRPPPDRRMASIRFPEEKRTDVNLAVRMTADAAADRFDFAVLVSTDSDFVGLCQMIRGRQFGKSVFLALPPQGDRQDMQALRDNVDGTVDILEAHLASSQLPDQFPAADGKRSHEKPRSWR